MEDVITTIIVALVAASPGIYAVYRQVRKDRVDNVDTLSDAALALLEPYKKEVAELRADMKLLRCELDNERAKRRQLETEVNQKNETIAAMQAEIDDLRGQIETLQKGRRK